MWVQVPCERRALVSWAECLGDEMSVLWPPCGGRGGSKSADHVPLRLHAIHAHSHVQRGAIAFSAFSEASKTHKRQKTPLSKSPQQGPGD